MWSTEPILPMHGGRVGAIIGLFVPQNSGEIMHLYNFRKKGKLLLPLCLIFSSHFQKNIHKLWISTKRSISLFQFLKPFAWSVGWEIRTVNHIIVRTCCEGLGLSKFNCWMTTSSFVSAFSNFLHVVACSVCSAQPVTKETVVPAWILKLRRRWKTWAGGRVWIIFTRQAQAKSVRHFHYELSDPFRRSNLAKIPWGYGMAWLFLYCLESV